MEFLRLGSSIPGSYWGCCAADVIQNFNCNPDDKASIQLVEGDGGQPLQGKDGFLFAGKTYKDIFLQRLRYGTFSTDDMPNHGFIVILSDSQLRSSNGKKWLSILKEQGFEFIRTINNSVWDVNNYVFALFRNVSDDDSSSRVADQFTPPKQWLDLPSVVPEAWERIEDRQGLTDAITDAQRPLYDALPKGVFYSEAELEAEGVPVTYAGQRSTKPQQSKKERLSVEEMERKKAQGASAVAKTAQAPWSSLSA